MIVSIAPTIHMARQRAWDARGGIGPLDRENEEITIVLFSKLNYF
jgi:hypothetical protein